MQVDAVGPLRLPVAWRAHGFTTCSSGAAGNTVLEGCMRKIFLKPSVIGATCLLLMLGAVVSATQAAPPPSETQRAWPPDRGGLLSRPRGCTRAPTSSQRACAIRVLGRVSFHSRGRPGPCNRLSRSRLWYADLPPDVVISLWPDSRRSRMAGSQVFTEDSATYESSCDSRLGNLCTGGLRATGRSG